jgi:hypothetical protein
LRDLNPRRWTIGFGDGSGAETAGKNLTRILTLASMVRFWGFKVLKSWNKLADSHVLVHPSLHDSGGCVCLEPMAAGRVICLDLGGPAPARDTEHRARFQSGRERLSRLYHWEEKGKYLADLYNQAISANF